MAAIASQARDLAAASYGVVAPPTMGLPTLAPGRLAKLTTQARARLLKRTPQGLLPNAALRTSGANTVLD